RVRGRARRAGSTGGVEVLSGVDPLGLAGAGGAPARGASRTAGRMGGTTPGGQGNPSSDGRGPSADVPGEQSGAHEVRRVPAAGAADHVQLRGERGQAIQPAGQGDGEVLGRRRGRSHPPVARRSPQRRSAVGCVLGTPPSTDNGPTSLPPGRVTANHVVRPTRGRSSPMPAWWPSAPWTTPWACWPTWLPGCPTPAPPCSSTTR